MPRRAVNSIGDAGATAIAQALNTNTSLTELGLGSACTPRCVGVGCPVV